MGEQAIGAILFVALIQYSCRSDDHQTTVIPGGETVVGRPLGVPVRGHLLEVVVVVHEPKLDLVAAHSFHDGTVLRVEAGPISHHVVQPSGGNVVTVAEPEQREPVLE